MLATCLSPYEEDEGETLMMKRIKNNEKIKV